MSKYRQDLAGSKRCVIKIGSALLTNDGAGLNTAGINAWVDEVALLMRQGVEVILVSSGAVAEGMSRLGWGKRPKAIADLQAAAAVGQMGLVQCWENSFQQHALHTAQVLLVHTDLSDRQRYLNARSTLSALIEYGVVPVVNENDTVATDEIRFGDNDSLAALVANLVDADVLIILTDQNGMYTADPRVTADAELVSESAVDNSLLDSYAGGSKGELGRGGMATKLSAARLAARSGAHTVIVNGAVEGVLREVLTGSDVGTLLYSQNEPVAARKQWLAGGLAVQGKLVLDEGAVGVLKKTGSSLLAVGVKTVQGEFERGSLVVCVDGDDHEIARGLINYSADETSKIQGCASTAIFERLGYKDSDELIHRDNMVVH